MTTTYTRLKTLAEGIVGMESAYGRQLFTSLTIRKPRRCAACGVALPKGSAAFGPITHGQNRMHRLCVPCATD